MLSQVAVPPSETAGRGGSGCTKARLDEGGIGRRESGAAARATVSGPWRGRQRAGGEMEARGQRRRTQSVASYAIRTLIQRRSVSLNSDSLNPDSPPPDRAVEAVERDAEVRERLGLGVLGLRERQLGVGELEDRPHPGVEPPLGEAEVFLCGGDEGLRGLDPLLGLLDRDLGLLDILNDVELRGPHPLLRPLEAGLGLLVLREPIAAVDARPGGRQPKRPAPVERGLVAAELAAAVRAGAADVGEEVPEGLALGGLGRADTKLDLAVLGPLLEGLGAKPAASEVDRLQRQVVLDRRGRV